VGLSQVGFTMLLEMLVSHRSFSPLTLVGIGLIILPTAWTLLRGATQDKNEVVPLPLHKAA
jgi:hypothetical protein